EETVSAAANAPRGIVRSVAVSGIFGWIMLVAIVLAMPGMDEAAAQGNNVFYWTLDQTLPRGLALGLLAGIALAQYCCGLAALTSGSRMMYAFARDGGLPGSTWLRRISQSRAPAHSIWTVSLLALTFIYFVPYSAIAAS